MNELQLSKSQNYHYIINIQKSYMKLLYITFDNLLKKIIKSDCIIESGKFAKLFINKIKIIYEYIAINRYNLLISTYINKLGKPYIISNPIPNITLAYIEKLIILTNFKIRIFINNITTYQPKSNLCFCFLPYTDQYIIYLFDLN